MDDEVRKLLPKHKFDLENANAVVNLGYPAIAPVLSDLFMWIQDINWPVAQIVAPFLATIGTPIIPEIRKILKTNDGVWKLWVLGYVVSNSSVEVITSLKDDLLRIVTNPTEDEIIEEVVEKAQVILSRAE